MWSGWKGVRRTAGVAVGILLAAAGSGSALALAGGARGQQAPPTTITVIIPAPSPTVTGTTVTVAPPPSPPPSAPPVAPPPPQQPPPPAASPPPPAGGTPSPAPPPAPTSGSPPSADTSAAPEVPAAASAGSPSAVADRPRAASTATVASGPAVVRPDAYRRPPRKGADVPGAPSAGAVPLDDGALARARGRLRAADGRLPGLRRLRAGTHDVLALAGFPGFLEGAAAPAQARSGTEFPDVRKVLGERATVATGGHGVLSFGPLPSLVLSLVLLSSLLLVGALLPAGVLARTPVSPVRYARVRQPLAMAAVAILAPLAIASVAAALT